jgi:hypothetical protein
MARLKRWKEAIVKSMCFSMITAHRKNRSRFQVLDIRQQLEALGEEAWLNG